LKSPIVAVRREGLFTNAAFMEDHHLDDNISEVSNFESVDEQEVEDDDQEGEDEMTRLPEDIAFDVMLAQAEEKVK
jgi:hypothetical protein